MMIRLLRRLLMAAVAFALLAAGAMVPAPACTGITLVAVDGSVVHARTLEFAIDLHSDVLVVAGRTMAPWELGSWILENFANVDEVRAGLSNVVIPAVVFAQWGFAPEVHYIVTDASGNSIVVEYTSGALHTYDDLLGVVTNTPSFDWQMTNLRNYVNFSMTSAPPVKLGSVTLKATGQGSWMLGMPGDFTPPSRLVRAVAFSQSVFPSANGNEAVISAFHVLNQFDIPKGAARENEKHEHGNVLADYTIWTSAADLKSKRYYYRTYDDSRLRFVDLTKANLDAKSILKVPLQGVEAFQEMTPG